MGKNVPVNKDALAAEIVMMATELNRLMDLANKEGLRVTVEASHMLRGREINPLSVLRVSVLNRRTR